MVFYFEHRGKYKKEEDIMLPLPKLKELQSNLEYIKNHNHGSAMRYLQNQPNSSAKNEAAALLSAITNLVPNRLSDLDTWSDMLKKIIDSANAGNAVPYADDVTEKLFADISAYKDEITQNDAAGKLNAFLTADEYKQLSDPKIKDSNGDPVQTDLFNVIGLVDDISYFEQNYAFLYSNSQLDSFTKKIADYKALEDSMNLQQKLLMITAPDGLNAENIDAEVSSLEASLQQSKAGVTELAGKRKEYAEKYRDAFDKLKNAAEDEKKALDEEVEFYSSEGFRAQMIEKTNLVLEAELKLEQKTRERDLFNQSFNTFNSLADKRNDIVRESAGLTSSEDIVAKSVSTKISYFLSESEKNKAVLHKNGAEYIALQDKLKALTNTAEFSNKPAELKKRLDELKASASKYISEHQNDKNPLNAKMHQFRLNLAGRITTYCDKLKKSLENITWTKTEEMDQYIKHIEQHPESAVSLADYSGIVSGIFASQKQIVGEISEKIDSLKLYIDSLLIKEETMSRTGLETHTAYKQSVFKSVYYLLVTDMLDKRSFDTSADGKYDIDSILSGIRESLERPDPGIEKMTNDPATAYLFDPFDHIESNNMHNNFDFYDEFKTTANIKTALEAHRINTKLKEDFQEDLFIDRKVLLDYYDRQKSAKK